MHLRFSNANQRVFNECPLCSHNKVSEYYCWPDFDVLICARCGFRFVDTTDAKYPQNAQWVFDNAEIGPINPIQPHLRRRVSDILRFVEPPGAALDIGCGKGELSLLLTQAGFQCTGIDMKEKLIDRLRQVYPSVTWRCANAHELMGEQQTFDVISLYHLLEHVQHPVDCLRHVKTLARPGALVVVEVPNASGLEARLRGEKWHYYKVDHVNYFRTSDLQRTAEQAGLQVLGFRGYQHFSYPQDVLWKDFVKGALALIGFKDVMSVFLRV